MNLTVDFGSSDNVFNSFREAKSKLRFSFVVLMYQEQAGEPFFWSFSNQPSEDSLGSQKCPEEQQTVFFFHEVLCLELQLIKWSIRDGCHALKLVVKGLLKLLNC